MPKYIDPHALMREFGGKTVWKYNADTKSLFCMLCSISCPANRRCTVSQHTETKNHKKKLKYAKGQEGHRYWFRSPSPGSLDEWPAKE
ncbi:Putative LOC100569856, partial [Caligus rogercresseyi]